jgi:anti-anti-sigma factor
MGIKIDKFQEINVIRVDGKLTFDHGSIELRQSVKEMAEIGECHVLLNLDKVGFMDNIGLESLLICYHAITKCGGKIKFSNLSQKNHHLLEITNLVDVFDIHENEAGALESFNS